MKRLWYILLFFIVAIPLNAQSSYFQNEPDLTTSLQAIYSNINIINNSIYKLKRNIRNLKSELSKTKKSFSSDIENNQNNIAVNSTNIYDLKKQFLEIEVDYKSVLKKIELFQKDLSEIESDLTIHKQEIEDLKYNLEALKLDYFLLKNDFLKIPKLFYCTECYPKMALGFMYNNYITFNAKDLKALPSYAFDFTYFESKNFGFWINYISPFLVTITTILSDTLKISDQWNTNIFSGGFIYKYRPLSSNFSGSIGAGLFFGSSKFDEYLNSSIGFYRSGIKNTSTWGLNVKTVISYNELKSRNPLELFLSLNGLIAYDNIILNPGINGSHDLGRVLLYASFGIKFNFWGM